MTELSARLDDATAQALAGVKEILSVALTSARSEHLVSRRAPTMSR